VSLDRFMELFVGRSDVFAEQHHDGSYTPVEDPDTGVRRPITRQDYIEHGRGVHTYGIYTVRPEMGGGTHYHAPYEPCKDGCPPPGAETKLLVFDIDVMDRQTVYAITGALAVHSIDYWVEFSGKKGHHVWVFLEDWMDAGVVRRAGLAVLGAVDVVCEVFPKQDRLTGEGYGNLVKLPLGIHRGSGKWSTQVLGDWKTTQRAAAGQIEALAERFQEPPRLEPAPLGTWTGRPLPPCMQRVRERGVGEGKRDNALFALAIECKSAGKEYVEALDICLEANSRFDPPLPTVVVSQKARSAYASPYPGLKCDKEFLHDEEELLCSTACPRYPAIQGMAATQDGPPRSGASVVGPKFAVGQTIPLQITGELKRGDGRTAYTLYHPDVPNTPVIVL